jgi:PAS domain S-box-containing protein
MIFYQTGLIGIQTQNDKNKNMDTRPIKVLHLEDLPEDAYLVERVLRKSNYDFEIKVVDNQCEFEAGLTEYRPDVIISDHSLPSFNSLMAMAILKKTGLKIPFILVTGAVSDDFAFQTIKQGAADYILKDRLQRLPAAIFNSLEKLRMETMQEEIKSRMVESEKQFFDLLQHLPAAVYTCDVQGRILLYNKAAKELWGRNPKTSRDTWCGATLIMDKNGNVLDPSSSPMARAIAAGRSIFGEELIIERHDGTRRYVLAHPSPNFNSAGDIIGGTNMLVDITERKNSEVNTDMLVKHLQMRNKQMEQFAYMISHHLRAPIARILGLASIFNNNPEEDGFIIEKIKESTIELDQVVQDINVVLTARDPGEEKYEYVDFGAQVNNITKVLEEPIRETNAQITTDFQQYDGITTIQSYLSSIINNLLSNAIKFRLPGTQPRIHLQTFVAENFVCLSIADNGRGIDLEKNAKHIFTIYKKFHNDLIPGKGVGLYLVKAQAEALGGRVEAVSKINEGSEFRVYLPVLHNQHKTSHDTTY